MYKMLCSQQPFWSIIDLYHQKGSAMKKILFLLGAIITFIFSGTGAIKEINDMLQHESGQQTK